jgi:tetratricopeptide (TPR) repeat protein
MGQQLSESPRAHLLTRAAEELEAATAENAPPVDVWQNLCAVQELLGRNSKAAESYAAGLAKFPNDLQLRRMRGWFYANQKEYELAKADFREAIRISPHDSESHAGLGFVLARQGIAEDAQQEASAALLSGADNQLTLHSVACIFGSLSAVAPDQKHTNEDLAVAALQRAIAISGRNPTGADADERSLITNEWSFPESLRAKPDFKQLLDPPLPTSEN